jgi:hypothetical protein
MRKTTSMNIALSAASRPAERLTVKNTMALAMALNMADFQFQR